MPENYETFGVAWINSIMIYGQGLGTKLKIILALQFIKALKEKIESSNGK